MASKFGNGYKKDDGKIKIIDKQLGTEIIRMIEITHNFEKEIIDKLEENTRELKRRINTRMNNIKDMLEKKSYTIRFLNKLEVDTNINCENCEIALVGFHTNKLLNIHEGNNTIEYKTEGRKWKTFFIEKGCYDLSSFSSYIKKEFPGVNFIKEREADRFTIQEGLSIKLSNQLANLIGIEGNRIYTEKDSPVYLKFSDNFAKRATPLINIHLNCIKNNYLNGQESSIIYSFFVHDGCKVNERPKNLIYYPIKENIKKFKVEIKDLFENNFIIDECYLEFHIQN